MANLKFYYVLHLYIFVVLDGGLNVFFVLYVEQALRKVRAILSCSCNLSV